MTVFQHILWGYELTYPNLWVHQKNQDTDYFVSTIEALNPEYEGSDAGQIQVRGEWNWARQNIEPLWNMHIGKIAGILGAKNVGSAPWRIGDSNGIEAEIVLPKKDNNRLWTGILMHDFCVLHFMVMHPKDKREEFEPEATRIISSLQFPKVISGSKITSEGLPLPPNFDPIDPQKILDDITDAINWRAFTGEAEVGALQSFYLRELLAHNWEIVEYIPFSSMTELGFARYKLQKEKQKLILGLLPSEKADPNTGHMQASIVYKITTV
ncbi:MAG: hypothetical protein C0410_00310 [Anaerolinea sp.]|nr:hypothetical protein [Anaerolinea sp.]